MIQVAPYGSWKSPITSDLIVTSAIALGSVALDGDDLYWIEGRPLEGGRQVVVRRRRDGTTEDVLPAPFNARTRVHEYGGGSFTLHDGIVYFSNFIDQRLYRLLPGSSAPGLFSRTEGIRYADAVIDAVRGLMYCVREDHTGSGKEPENAIVAIDLESAEEILVASGNDFHSTTRLSPDGRRLCWLTWNHPNMPWDGNELWVADLNEAGSPEGARKVAGGPEESIFQPQWSPDGRLYFVSDRTGWWNIYCLTESGSEAVAQRKAEFGVPQWGFDARTYDFLPDGRILSAFIERGMWRLGLLDPSGNALTDLNLPLSSIRGLRTSANGKVYFLGSSPTTPEAIYEFDPDSRELVALRWSTDLRIHERYLSVAEPVEFPTEEGLTAHALYYAPKNRDFAAPSGERPPLIVMSHGGPTSATNASLNLQKQYWTSRGFALLDVNYGGSTGYGRAYRERLNGRWGIVDVDDCVNGATYLVERGLVDPGRMAITGGSAGGYTTLCALTFRDRFGAGASHFGVADLEALTRETHKFESRYLDRLVGPYPERRDLYVERSPIHYVDRLSCPVIFFQGLEDEIVPPNQAEKMVDALRQRGVPVAYLPFEGEQHGFRKASNIKRSLDAQLYFFGRIFGFQPADQIEPVEIENL